MDASFGATTYISSLWNQRLFSKSSGHMFASHATNHGCLVTVACLTTASSKASFLGVPPSECQKYTEKTRRPPLTFTYAWAILPWLPWIESIAPSSAPTTAPRLLSTATKTPPDVCLRSSVPALSSVILVAFAANIHPSLASLLNCSSSTPSRPIEQGTPQYFGSFFISVLSSSCSCLHLCEVSSVHLCSLDCTSCCILITASVLFCCPSAASLTLSQFCSTIRKRKSHFPNFTKACLALGRLAPFLLSFSFSFSFSSSFLLIVNCLRHYLCTFWSFFISIKDKLVMSSLHFLPPFHFSVLDSFSSSFTSLPFSFLELGIFRPDGFYLQRCLAFPGCFLQRSLGPYPGCFYLGSWGLHVGRFLQKVFWVPSLAVFTFPLLTDSSFHPFSFTDFHPLAYGSAARVEDVSLLD